MNLELLPTKPGWWKQAKGGPKAPVCGCCDGAAGGSKSSAVAHWAVKKTAGRGVSPSLGTAPFACLSPLPEVLSWRPGVSLHLFFKRLHVSREVLGSQ